MIERSRLKITPARYLEIRGEIVSREEGMQRRTIEREYMIVDGRFVKKSGIDKAIEEGKAPIGICAKDPAEENDAFDKYISTNLGFIQEFTKAYNFDGDFGPTRFNDIQSFLMDCDDPFIWVKKTRQFGFSYLSSAKAVAKAMLKPRHTSIFVSYNEEESKEKIIYARELYDSMPRKWQIARKLKYDNKTSLVFERMGKTSGETRILSYPQRIIRGKGGELDILIDEGAHCIHLRKIYVSAIPALSRSPNSTLCIGSSPAGKSGLFYEIGANTNSEYNNFLRIKIPWWVVPEFCIDVAGGRKLAWGMTTDERVRIFATDRIKLIRKNMPLEDFQQEYECEDLDEVYSYFSWDLINSCATISDIMAKDTPDFDSPASDLKSGDKSVAGKGIPLYNDFDQFMSALRSGKIKGKIIGGIDVGRTVDATEVMYATEDENTHQVTPLCNITWKNMRMPEQRRRLLEQVGALGSRLVKVGIDNNGIGCNLAEDLEEKSFDLVVKLNFNSNSWKEEACRRFKLRMEKKLLELPLNRPLLSQIHSIKRILLPGGLWRFDAEKNAKHHGDKFWALLGACEMATLPEDAINEFSNMNSDDVVPNRSKLKPHNDFACAVDEMFDSKYNPYGGFGTPALYVPQSLREQTMSPSDLIYK